MSAKLSDTTMSDSGSINYPKVTFSYDPSKAAALVFGSINAVITVLLFMRLWRRKHWWGLCLPIGTLCFSAGFFLRFASAEKPTDLALFVVNQIFVVVSPAAFLAFNYIVYGRLVAPFTTGRDRYSFIRPEKVAKIFVISDLATFNVQGGGGGLLGQEGNKPEIGRIILLVGIALQALSYVFFYVLLIHSHRKFCKDSKFDKYNFPWCLMRVLHFSSVFIIIRSVYRIIELAQGNNGYLASHEVFFYVLDAIPLFFATTVYTYFWPGKMIEDVISREDPSITMEGMGRLNRERSGES